MPDHPRIRGEHDRTRPARWAGPRIIPAYAGSTLRAAEDTTKFKDHPRIRGEHGALKIAWEAIKDHPRIRGEHQLMISWWCRKMGSSPHTRGARSTPTGPASGIGIIPAYAGSTTPPTKSPSKQADHPRIRGEHALRVGDDLQVVGSSPHTRGALDRNRILKKGTRIIPAYAGSTFSFPFGYRLGLDHPRIRGEHFLWWWSLSQAVGSSPHTRGARLGRLPEPRP